MTNATENLIRNLLSIFSENNSNATQFCLDCSLLGINIKRSTLSRVLTGKNTGLNTLSEIVIGVQKCYPSFAWVTESVIISDKFDSYRIATTDEKFRLYLTKLFDDLQKLGWINVAGNRKAINDFAVLKANECGVKTNQP